MPIIKTEKLTKIYRQGAVEVVALSEVDIQISHGDFAVVAGPSGSGKTTFLNLLGALDKPTSGKIWLDEQEITALSRTDRSSLRRNHIGFVFQFYNLIPVLTAYENAEFVLLLQGVDQVQRRKKVLDLLSIVGLSGLEDRYPHELSGGQQQRVAIARALASEPALVLADEPTANLDTKTGQELLDLMQQLNSDINITFLFSSHDPEVMERARRLIILRDGRVVEDRIK